MNNTLGKLRKQKFYLLVLLLYVAYVLVFAYVPMHGMVLAFKNYSIRAGILGSEWAGLKYFRMLFSSPDFGMIIRNTLGMAGLSILFGFPAPILFALLINEISGRRFKRIVQSVSYLPHFISWIVVVGIFTSMFSRSGIFNDAVLSMGLASQPIDVLGDKDKFWWIITFLGMWKEIGWSSIVYLSAITSIDSQMYEAAIVEGAGRVRLAFTITVPSIMPTIMMLFVFRLGYILNVGFEQQLFLQNPMNYKMAEVLDTYVFKMGLQKFMYSYATAVSVFKGTLGLVLVIIANRVVKKINGSSAF